MIEEEKSPEKLYQFMLRHAHFCEKYGRKPDAIKIYQKMIEIFYENPEEIISNLEECEENQNNDGGSSYRKVVCYDEDLIEKIRAEQKSYENKNSDRTSTYSLDRSVAFWFSFELLLIFVYDISLINAAIIITNKLIVDVWFLGKYFLTQKQGEVTLKDIEKSIQELPLPEKIRALAIYKRYKHIRKVED